MKCIDIDTVVANGGSHIPLNDSEEVGTEKMLRNSRIRLELQEKAARQAMTDAMTLVRVHQDRRQEATRKAAADYKAAEEAKPVPRLFAWLMVLASLYYIPALSSSGFEPTIMFGIWVCAWCLWGYISIMEMFDGSFIVVLLLWVVPYYMCGPLLYLWESYTWSHTTKLKEANNGFRSGI